MIYLLYLWELFFFNDTATTEIYTLSLHDALPISITTSRHAVFAAGQQHGLSPGHHHLGLGQHRLLAAVVDRKSTRLNSSHANISYAVFCLKKNNEFKLYLDTLLINTISTINSIHT